MNPIMEKTFRWIKSYVKCSLKGGDLERLFNMCRNHGIEIWDMVYDQGICYCYIYVKDFWKICRFIRKTHVRLRIENKYGLAFLINYFKYRYTLWIGFFLSLIFLWMLTSRIWKIEIYGNSYYTDERITKYLMTQENLYYGIRKSNIDGSVLEENLRLSFPDISWVSVRTEGTSLMIHMEEMVKYDKPNSSIEKNRYICADMDGEIMYMVTRSGTPYVTIGEQVKKGDLLIDGMIALYDDAMNVMEKRLAGADGDIWAKVVWPYESASYFTGESVKFERTHYKWKISAGDFSFNIGSEPNFKEDGIIYHHLTEFISLIPGIQLQKEIYRPYEVVSTIEVSSDAKEKLEAKMSDLYNEFYEKGVQILENNVKIIMYENRAEAKGNMILLWPIGISTDILLNHTEITENGETYEYN